MKYLFLIILTIFTSVSVKAEQDSSKRKFPHSISFSLSAGNNFIPIGHRTTYSTEAYYTDVTNSGEYEYFPHDWTAGIGYTRRASIDLGLTDWLVFGIGYYGAKGQLTKTANNVSMQDGMENVVYTTQTEKGTLDCFEIGLKLLKELPSWNLYFGVDAMLPIQVGSNRYYEQNNNGKITIVESKDFGGSLFGLNSCIGAEIKFGDHLSALFECNSNWINYEPAEWEKTRHEIDGEDQLPEFKQWQKHATYEKGYRRAYGEYADNESGVLLQRLEPFGALGLSVGLKYTL